MKKGMVGVGDKAPLWTLSDQNEKNISLEEYKGKKNVVLVFHPLAWTPVCSLQMKELETRHDDFARFNAIAFGFSVDSIYCKKAWAEKLGIINTSLPSDFWPHGGVARLYGVFDDENGFGRRSTIIVDTEGIIAFKKLYQAEKLPDIEETFAELRKLEQRKSVMGAI